MSGFLDRWQELARASQELPPAAMPPVPLRHWPVRLALRRAPRSRDERRGLVLGAIALAATWALAVALWPAVTVRAEPAGVALSGPALAPGPTAGDLLPPVAHLSSALPALPHPAAPTALFAQAYVALTSSEPQEPHL